MTELIQYSKTLRGFNNSYRAITESGLEIRKLQKKLQEPEWLDDLTIIDFVENYSCSLEEAQHLRQHTWYVPLKGVSNAIPIEERKIRTQK